MAQRVEKPRRLLVSILRTFARWSTVAVLFVVGGWMIYGFGGGYFGDLSVPTPLNMVLSLVLLALLIVGLLVFLRATE